MLCEYESAHTDDVESTVPGAFINQNTSTSDFNVRQHQLLIFIYFFTHFLCHEKRQFSSRTPVEKGALSMKHVRRTNNSLGIEEVLKHDDNDEVQQHVTLL